MISSRLAKPAKQSRKEPSGDRSRMLIVGERLMRAGSEGNLLRSTPNQQQELQEQSLKMISNPEKVKRERRPCSAEDVDSLDRKSSSRDVCDRSNPWSPRTLPRKHALTMQTQNAERRREAFLELLKQKYPHHASTIAGHQEKLRDHIRTQGVLGEQECVRDVMSEGEALASFTRGSRTRASLPVVKSSNHTKERSLGVLYLQYGEETKQILMPNEVSSADTVRALFVSAFPQQLTLAMLESPNMAIYTKDHVRNVYYELTDVRNITPHSYLKVYHKDPNQAFNHNSRNNNGDARVSRERLYSSRQQQAGGQSMGHTLPVSQNPIQGLQGSLSPPLARSVPSSPSRFSYNSRTMPAGATLPRERVSSTPCSSAILERRDVKPDEDVDPYGFPEARLSMSDAPDGSVFHHHSLYRQKSRKYSENQHGPLSPKNQKTPPPSPQRVNEVRMIDIHPGQNPHMMVERTSSLRRSYRKESNGTLEVAARARGNMAPPTYTDLHGERPFQGLVTSADPQSKRMKAMEQQLASLTGLVQHALLKGTNSSGGKETASEKLICESLAQDTNSGGVSPVAVCRSPTLLSEPPVSLSLRDPPLGILLSTFRRNVSSLRQQLHQIRQTQLQNQLAMRTMLKQAEEELTVRMCEKLQMLEEPLKKQRMEVDEERHRYEVMEESVLLQLGELEKHVEQLKRNSSSAQAQRPITLRDVEDGAVNLRKVGEKLATLKGEFPALQSRMHAVLRMEVEAVRFLKEEPQKMDNMLKRVKALTETLSSLRIRATEGSLRTDPISVKPESPDSPRLTRDSATTPQHLSSNPTHFTITSSSNPAHCELVSVSSSPIMAQRSCSSALIPSHNRDAPAVVTVTSRSREESGDVPHVQDEPPSCRETAERDEAVDRRQAEEEADMERILQQAQANLMKNIPDLELTNQKSKASDTTYIPPDEVDTPHSPHPEATTPAEPVADKLVQTSSECVHKSPIEKLHRASVDRATPNQDAANKSPPPAPPRRLHLAATGLTTGRSGEVIYTTRKDPAPPQEREEEEALQSKPQRVRPELKPKPRTLPPVNAREEEEDDEDKIIAELQVFEKCPVKDLEPRYIVDLTTHVFPDRELEPAFSLSSYDPKSTALHCEDGKHSPHASPGSGVIYYITGTAKTPSDNPLGGSEVQNEPREGVVSSSKVAHPNSPDFTQQPNVLTPSDLTLDSPKSVEESLKVSTDTQMMYASLPESQKDISSDGDEAKIPKEASENITSKPENEELVSSENLIHASEKPSSNGSEVQVAKSLVRPKTLLLSEETRYQEDKQQVVMRSSRGRTGYSEETSLSPDLPAEEAPPPPDNIAFMITKTRVQALSTGEYQQLVSSKEQDVETVKVGTDETVSAPEDGEFSKKPVIIVFDEPMDIRQAYKRLSTIFECEEELDRTLSKERIIEDTEEIKEEEEATDTAEDQVKPGRKSESTGSGNHLQVPGQQQNLSECSSAVAEDASQVDLPSDAKQEAKKKFKFKFPKKQLAAIGQALRTGTKTGKKTLQVVVYEDEEEPDGTLKEAREAKRFEIKSNIDFASPDVSASEPSESQTTTQQNSAGRTNEICQTAYKTIDSLEETIKQLETTITNMDPGLSPDAACKDPKVKRVVENQTVQAESSPSKKPAPLGPKPQKPPQKKKSKVQCVPRPSSSSSLCSGSTKQVPVGWIHSGDPSLFSPVFDLL
ncbi:sickle tail protein homolog isoform X2 [Pangasianodon hypophthalmus]|uniref:sickle tail protein homolog isoform X2 n=1 Tax=Pangasianodon hypophthalmus TaxID=310915 RepID=UPI002307CA06|nr:sickle tail protein homolog isoform X2 [Pangasianodon hypophthalmus]